MSKIAVIFPTTSGHLVVLAPEELARRRHAWGEHHDAADRLLESVRQAKIAPSRSASLDVPS